MNKTKIPNKNNEVLIHKEIYALINRVDPKIKIKVIDKLRIGAQVRLSKYPYTIELTIGLLKNKFLTVDDVKVIVAHELGHIEFKKEYENSNRPVFCLIALFFLAIYYIWYFEILTVVAITLTLIIAAILLACIYRLIIICHNNEYRADSFVFSEKMSISLKTFEECFYKIPIILEKEYANKSFLMTYIERITRAITHPTIGQRISMARSLYKTIK